MKTVILGGGESGAGAALLAKKLGHTVFLSDMGILKAGYREELLTNEIPFEEGQHTADKIMDADQVVKSPGIPDTAPLLVALAQAGIPILSEIEFAARYAQGFCIGITGSNGKTTTTYLTHHLLKTAGIQAALVGNVGFSFARSIANGEHPCYVVELSSFQLDGIWSFRPHVAMILNITPDHLDRYEYQMSKYVASKFRIAMNQTETDDFLYFAEDPELTRYLETHHLKPKHTAISDSWIKGESIEVDGVEFDLSQSALRGIHNYRNALFAVKAALLAGASAKWIQEGLNSFQPVPHRLEKVGTVAGVTYINDSKATNVDAAFFGLQAMNTPTVWIAGGTDKGNDYEPLLALVKKYVKAMVFMGVDNTKLVKAFGDLGIPYRDTRTPEEAFATAAELATSGDTVLLSPACASFDLFKNYEDRGNQFKEWVLKLQKI